MNRCLAYIFFLFALSPLHAQDSPDKDSKAISLSLYRALEHADPADELHLVVQGQMTTISSLANQYEAKVKYAYSDIGAIVMPAGRVREFAKLPAVEYLDISTGKGLLLNDEMRNHTNVDSVHGGLGDLPDSIGGEDVIVAFLDTGLELEHPDFWNPDSSTRVKYVWDQNAGTGPNTPTKYGYGQVWDSANIDSGNCPHADDHGHGTRVAGIGSGNGWTAPHYKGSAPKSDIIIVEIDLGANFLSGVTDAVDFVFSKADELGKPAVVNASLGSYVGSHDGKDLYTKLIENMLDEKSGRVMVCAAGNGGDKRIHLGYPITDDTSFTWYRYYNARGYAYIQVWADTSDFNKAYFSIGINRNNNYQLVDRTPFRNTLADFNLSAGINKVTDTLKNDMDQRVGTVDIYAEQVDNRYVFDLVTYLDSTNYFVQLAATGEGRFDSWSSQNETGSSNFVNGNLPDTTTYPPIKYYRPADMQQTLVSGWACSPKVISVANFYNRNKFANWRGDTTRFNHTPGQIVPSSSIGPTRTGLLKPDISAPGEITLSPAPLDLLNNWKNGSLKTYVSDDGWHARMVGTSASAPAVTGIAALYLSHRPDADYAEVLEAIKVTARQDTFTGPNLPNNIWGYGKIDAYSMLTAVKGCMDTSALNYDPQAVLSDSCTYPPIGFTAPIDGPRPSFQVYPNPAQDQFVIVLTETSKTSIQISVMNSTGQLVRNESADGMNQLTMNRGSLPNGLYVVSLWKDGQYQGARSIILN